MKLHHQTSGEGEPLVILHGLFGMLDNWKSISRKLSSSYQCILVDLRNHGKSPHDAEMNYQVMAEDVKELISDLQIAPTIVIGHSMGGKVAMQLALHHPESVKKLVVIDIAPRQYPPHHEKVLAALESIDPSAVQDRAEAEENFRTYLGNDKDTIQFLLKNMSRLPEEGYAWKSNMEVIVAEYDEVMNEIKHDGTFEKPVLFIKGGNSSSLTDEDLPDIKMLFPNVEWVTIPDAGHWVHSDEPEALLDALRSFIET